MSVAAQSPNRHLREIAESCRRYRAWTGDDELPAIVSIYALFLGHAHSAQKAHLRGDTRGQSAHLKQAGVALASLVYANDAALGFIVPPAAAVEPIALASPYALITRHARSAREAHFRGDFAGERQRLREARAALISLIRANNAGRGFSAPKAGA